MATLTPAGPKTPTSPKVKSGMTWATVATLAATALTAITPDMLTALGPYAGLVYGVISAVAFGIGAWQKEDALRTVGAQVLANSGPRIPDETPALSTEKTPSPSAETTPYPAALPLPLPLPSEGQGPRHLAE